MCMCPKSFHVISYHFSTCANLFLMCDVVVHCVVCWVLCVVYCVLCLVCCAMRDPCRVLCSGQVLRSVLGVGCCVYMFPCMHVCACARVKL